MSLLDDILNDPDSYADLLAMLQTDLQLDLSTGAQANTFPIVSGLLVWHPATLINSWANLGAGFETAAYLKDPLGFVHLKGVVAAGVSATVIFTLPAGYRPGAITIHPAGSGGSPPVGAVVHIDTAGNVTGYYNTGSSDVGLSGITFLAEN